MLQVFQNLFSPGAYLNAGSVLAGLLLVSVPVIIHLINRMRFRRVRWAAMEFLLKAQKKMRRKLIIEQLLLLLLRMLLMFLVGLLVGRFIGFDMTGEEKRNTQHLVVLDDSPSMGDTFKDDSGVTTDAFTRAKRLLAEKLAPAAAEATTPQRLDLMRTSEPDNVTQFDRLNAGSIDAIKAALVQHQPTTVRAGLADTVKRAGDRLLATGGADTARVLHVLSDFRANDWAEDGQAVRDEVDRLVKGGVKVHLIDVAHPFRNVTSKAAPLFHDNVAIVEFKPSKAVVARYEPVEFTLKVQNFGTSELKDVRFSLRVNGDENKGTSVIFGTLPPGQVMVEKRELIFDRVGSPENVVEGGAAGAKLDDAKKAGAKKAMERFNLVTAVLETGEPGGLTVDNSRHTCVEVRDRLPILVVDGTAPPRDAKTGDSFFLSRALASTGGGYKWTAGTPAALGTDDLSKYSFVMLLNVPAGQLTEAGVRNLEGYVRNGGGCGFFVGGLLEGKGDEYTKALYRDGEGLFPLPLPKEPTKELTEEEQFKKEFNILQKKILVRDPAAKAHPALAGLYSDERGHMTKDADEVEKFYRFVTVKRYFPVRRIGKWREDPTVTELYCLPNDAKVGDEQSDRRTADFAAKLREVIEDPEVAAYKELLAKHVGLMDRQAKTATELTDLIAVFDKVLADQKSEGDPDEPKLREFWNTPKAEVTALKAEMARFRDGMKFGDPLYVAKQFGRGRVTVMLTTAGDGWNNWASAQPGSVSYTPMIKEMVNYLSGGGVDDAHPTGRPIRFALDQDNYDAKVLRGFITHDGRPGRPPVGGTDPAPVEPGDQFDPVEASAADKTWVVTTPDTTRPGAYLFALEQKRPLPGDPNTRVSSPEYRFVPVNVDAAREGDLRRASTDDLLQGAPGAGVHSVEDKDWIDQLKNKKTDLSELGWVFLAVLAVLVAEQALAVRLSFHGAADAQDAVAPTAAAAMRQTARAADPDDAPAGRSTA